jgi:hypothetical protein
MEEYDMEDGTKGVYQHDYEAVIVDRPKGTERIVGWGIG